MDVQMRVEHYLDYCEFRKELDQKTLKAYRIDLRQYFDFVRVLEPAKEKIEEYITELNFKVISKISLSDQWYDIINENLTGRPARWNRIITKQNLIKIRRDTIWEPYIIKN